MKFIEVIFLVLAILFGVCGIYLINRWGIQDDSLLFIICLLPAILFLITSMVWRKWNHFEARVILILGSSVSVMVLGGTTFLVESFLKATGEVTDVREYEELLSDCNGTSKLLSHFPASIPAGVTNVRFSFLPSFWQGGGHLQLRYCTTSKDIRALHYRFSEMKTKSFMGGADSQDLNEPGGMPSTSFYTSDNDSDTFPSDYEIMIFDELPTSEGHSWNHGESHGVAISIGRNEIVYWAEWW